LPVDFDRNVHCLLGLPFDIVDMEGALARVRSTTSGGPRCFLSTPNLNFLIACQDDPAFRASVINSDLCIADGMPLVWMARLLGLPIRERIAGSSLFEALRRDVERPMSVYFFGAPPGVAEQACARLNAEAGGLRCVGFECPGFGSVEDMSSSASIDRINASGADFVVVALGARKGQAWIERNRSRLDAPVISHLGAVIGFVAGSVSRAPAWMQRTGLEWLWRIKEEPDLWRRYFKDGLALAGLLVTRVLPYAVYLRRYRLQAGDGSRCQMQRSVHGSTAVIRLSGAWNESELEQLRRAFADAVALGGDIWLDLESVSYVDSAFVGLVMLLSGWQSRNGKPLQIVAASMVTRKVFGFCGADFLLETEPQTRCGWAT
jgi:N-acetylglucosaminyldiphosphoundecaprenol N-acetyl-beta-D-mannosaminyltransferase